MRKRSIFEKDNNIRQRKDGRFEARYTKDRDEQGQIIWGYCYGWTYEEAAEKRNIALYYIMPIKKLNLLILGAGATVGLGAKIGRGCIISSGATIGKNTFVEDWMLVDEGETIIHKKD